MEYGYEYQTKLSPIASGKLNMTDDADDGGARPGTPARTHPPPRARRKTTTVTPLQQPRVGSWFSKQDQVLKMLFQSWEKASTSGRNVGFGAKQGMFKFGYFRSVDLFLDWYPTEVAHQSGAAILQFIVDSPLMASSLYFDIETYIPYGAFNKSCTEVDFFRELKKWLFVLLPELDVPLRFLENLMYMDRVPPRKTTKGMKLVYTSLPQVY